MSEETAAVYSHARRNGVSSEQAWEDVSELADETEWDVERMLSDPQPDSRTDTISDQELRR